MILLWIDRLGSEFQSSMICDSGDCMGRSSVQFPTMSNAILLIFESIGASARYPAANCLTEMDEPVFVFFLVSKSKQMWFKIIPYSSLVGWWPLWSSLFSFVFCLALFVLWRPNQLDSILRFAFWGTATVDSGNGFALIAAILHGLCEKLLKRSSRKLGRSTIVADCWGVPPFGPSSIVNPMDVTWSVLWAVGLTCDFSHSRSKSWRSWPCSYASSIVSIHKLRRHSLLRKS